MMYNTTKANVRLSRHNLLNRLASFDKKSILPETVADLDDSGDIESQSLKKPLLSSSKHNTSKTRPRLNSGNTAKEEEASTDNPSVIPTHAYATLASAVIALSSIGPSLDLQHGVAPTMKIYWRMTGTYLTLAPLAAHTLYKYGLPQLTLQQACTFVCASFCYAVMCIGFVCSLEYTSVGNAVIFSNTHALLLLFGRFLVGSRVSVFEGVGALIAFVGGVCCTLDASGSAPVPETEAPIALLADADDTFWKSCWGNLMAVISALGGTLYLVLAKTVRAKFPSIPLFVFMNMFTASCVTFTYMRLVGQDMSFSRDIHVGLWGFLHSQYDRLPLEMFMVVVCNLTGSMGYLRSTQYFDNLAISVATLMEPVVASLLAFIVGVGALPGALGWWGNMLVAAGTVTVITPRPQKKDS